MAVDSDFIFRNLAQRNVLTLGELIERFKVDWYSCPESFFIPLTKVALQSGAA